MKSIIRLLPDKFLQKLVDYGSLELFFRRGEVFAKKADEEYLKTGNKSDDDFQDGSHYKGQF